MKNYLLEVALGLIFAATLIAYVVYAAISTTPLTTLEALFFQVLVLVLGIVATSAISKKVSFGVATKTNQRLVKPALRRSLTLYRGLFELSTRIQFMRFETSDDLRLEMIQALVDEHIRTSADAIEDWRDILPGEIPEPDGAQS
ncbi:MAG: hypothetical protein OXP37_03935 [Chloroflexota bacterium]|nr:hypothetical protein [Chloroflexota bacterium]